MAIKKAIAKAPTRIDLAGGTVDLWPLYLFLKTPVTVNVGINLFASTELTEETNVSDGGVVFESADQSESQKITWKDLYTADVPRHLLLHLKLLRYYLDQKKSAGKFNEATLVRLKTSAQSPAGAGLGGSSTLSISMIGALKTWANDFQKIPTAKENGIEMIATARDIETTIIDVPAGMQDYYGAVYGGVQRIYWGIEKNVQEHLSSSLLDGLSDRLILFYSGVSRNSGINNWDLFQKFINKEELVRSRFQVLGDTADRLATSLQRENWSDVGEAIRSEWETRKTLAEGISTPEIDQAFALGKEKGFTGKICGAGGGGCFFLYQADPDQSRANDLAHEITSNQEIRRLPFEPVAHGLEVIVDGG